MRTGAIEFFMEHAGFSYDPKTETKEQGRRRCAESLAKAEYAAWDACCYFVWGADFDDCSDGDETPVERQVCILHAPDGEVLASLGGICDPSQEYCRVIEAELALEAGI